MSTVWHGDHLLRTLFLRSIVLQTDSQTIGPTHQYDYGGRGGRGGGGGAGVGFAAECRMSKFVCRRTQIS